MVLLFCVTVYWSLFRSHKVTITKRLSHSSIWSDTFRFATTNGFDSNSLTSYRAKTKIYLLPLLSLGLLSAEMRILRPPLLQRVPAAIVLVFTAFAHSSCWKWREIALHLYLRVQGLLAVCTLHVRATRLRSNRLKHHEDQLWMGSPPLASLSMLLVATMHSLLVCCNYPSYFQSYDLLKGFWGFGAGKKNTAML